MSEVEQVEIQEKDSQTPKAPAKPKRASTGTAKKTQNTGTKRAKKPVKSEIPEPVPVEVPAPAPIIVPEPVPAPVPQIEEPKKRRSLPKLPSRDRRARPTRERFFHESHPGAYNLVSSIPMYCLTAVVIYIAYLVLANMDSIMSLMFNPDAVIGYLERNWVILTVFMTLMAVLVYILYSIGWRAMFPDYFIRYDTADVFDGRLYWSDNHALVQLWDHFYGSPERTQIRYFIHQKWLPLTLNVVTTSPEERLERKDMWSVVVLEKRLRKVVERRRKRTYFQTYDDTYHHQDVPEGYVKDNFSSRMRLMLDATTRASYGNPEVSVDVVRHGSTLIGEDFREAIQDARKNEQEQTPT